ncbi:hypothetical protein CO683_35255 [Bradyrhizobium ottawaense]|uniref:hypothetical protein n=1 Tax=Bradyrhizobium ottawaense TaxID=931866 RepID=UPI000BE95816|nr:hypothetical protein [Bradyrhizobium ottawaense]PDT64902.1 hypothetical protein CO683_35255 [Bradyrhizobium ottawaense]
MAKKPTDEFVVPTLETSSQDYAGLVAKRQELPEQAGRGSRHQDRRSPQAPHSAGVSKLLGDPEDAAPNLRERRREVSGEITDCETALGVIAKRIVSAREVASKAAEDYYGITKDPRDVQMAPATDRLGAALKNYAAGTAATRQAQDVATAVGGDKSKDPAKQVDEQADAYTRATEAIDKHIARLQADAQAEGLGAAAQAQMRAEAALTTAAMQAYGKVTPEIAAKNADLAAKTGEAAAALEKAKVAAAIEFSQKTAFLSDEDVSIARQLAGVYGNDVNAALNSTAAEAVRVNGSLGEGI